MPDPPQLPRDPPTPSRARRVAAPPQRRRPPLLCRWHRGRVMSEKSCNTHARRSRPSEVIQGRVQTVMVMTRRSQVGLGGGRQQGVRQFQRNPLTEAAVGTAVSLVLPLSHDAVRDDQGRRRLQPRQQRAGKTSTTTTQRVKTPTTATQGREDVDR